MTDTPLFTASESAELLLLAEQIGRIGVIDWQVPQGTVRMSAKALEIYGLDQFDGRYDSWIATVHREDATRLRDIIATALAAREREFELDFRIVRQNDKALRWIHARRLVFYDAAGAPVRVVGVSADVTDRKRELVELRNFTETLEEAVKARTRELEAENEARRKAEESLRQAQKMEAIGQLTGGVAHDFNNLLTIVLGGLDAIGRRLPDLPPSPAIDRISRARDMAVQGAQRAATLTSRLLAFSRQQALAPQAVDANKLVAGICDFLRQTLGEAVSLETVLAGGLWRTFADAEPAGERDPQSRAQRARRDAGRRQADDRDRQLLSRPGLRRHVVRAGRCRAIRDDRGGGHRNRHGRGNAGARVRSVLHDQERRQGHGIGPEPGLRLRPSKRRPCPDLQRGRRGHDREGLPAAPPGRARYDAGRERARARRARGRRNDPGGRRRREPARLHDRAS